jgi:hypothetical protein
MQQFPTTLILRWPSVCPQAYQAYKVYTATSATGPFTTLIATTTDTTLTLSLPAATRQFYTVVSYTDCDQIGIDHNRGLSYIDARLIQAGADSTWTKEQFLDSVKVFSLDFTRDSTCYDYEIAEKVIADTALYVASSYERIMTYLDSLETMKLVTEREVTYLTRLFDIVYLDTLLSDSIHEGSLEAFENDVLAVQWNDDEVFCLAFTSVALHSWNFLNDGLGSWNPDGRPVNNFDLRRLGGEDVLGATVGAGVCAIALAFGPVGWGTFGAVTTGMAFAYSATYAGQYLMNSWGW